MILRETEEFGNRLLLFPNSIASDCFGFEISRSLASVSAEFFSCEQFSFRILQFHTRRIFFRPRQDPVCRLVWNNVKLTRKPLSVFITYSDSIATASYQA